MQPLAALVEEPLLLAAAVEEPHLLAAAVEGPLLLAVPEGEEVAQHLAVQEVVAPEAHEVLVRLVRLGHHLLQLLMCGHHLGLPNRSLVRVKIGAVAKVFLRNRIRHRVRIRVSPRLKCHRPIR